MSKIMPIQNKEQLCHNCLKEKETIIIFEIRNRSYGSEYFDNVKIKLQLCKDCIKKLKGKKYLEKIFNEKPHYAADDTLEYIEIYDYEKDIISLLDNLPVQSKEIILNNYHASDIVLESQDYIDIVLNIAKPEIYKKYGIITEEEIEKSEYMLKHCTNLDLDCATFDTCIDCEKFAEEEI